MTIDIILNSPEYILRLKSIQFNFKFTSIFQICLTCLFFWHTDTYSVFFRLNTDTSVFENHTGYSIIVFIFILSLIKVFLIYFTCTIIFQHFIDLSNANFVLIYINRHNMLVISDSNIKNSWFSPRF